MTELSDTCSKGKIKQNGFVSKQSTCNNHFNNNKHNKNIHENNLVNFHASPNSSISSSSHYSPQ
jgi:hypothetical protein